MTWSALSVSDLRIFIAQGLMAKEIAAIYGCTIENISGKARRLGLQFHARPGRDHAGKFSPRASR